MMQDRLGWIAPSERTQEQHDAHAEAHSHCVKFTLPPIKLAPGQKVSLFDAWGDPDVVADVGFKFDRIHQLTGSCVWAGGTNAVMSTIAMQRVAGENPTQAFLPFTLHNYALSRQYAGMTRRGDGSMGSTFAKSLTQDGIIKWERGGSLPAFDDKDGISVQGSSVEYDWSVVTSQVQAVLPQAKVHLFGSAAECSSVANIQAMLTNGYGVTFACDRYIGHASVVGEGQDACVVGRWDSSGGHQQSIHGVWLHPNLGPLYWAQNNWPGSTYPRDPSGGPVCGCYVKEADVEKALSYQAEVYGLSHLTWFPAQPKVVDWFAAT